MTGTANHLIISLSEGIMKATDLPLHYNAVDILERNLDERADKVALYSFEREMTFREVSNEVNQVGNALKALGVRRGDFVGILSSDCPEWVTTFFGAIKIGAVAVGINTLLSADEYAYILRDCRAWVLVIHESLLPAIEEIRDGRHFPEHVVVIGETHQEQDLSYNDWIRDQATELEVTRTHRDDFCALNYSSGTTGEPKGILHSHKNYPLCAELYGTDVVGLHEGDRTFAISKLFFTYGLGGNLICPWYFGSSIVLMSGSPRSARNVLETVHCFKPTVLFGVPTAYGLIMASEEFCERQFDLSALRLCVSAGEALPASVWHDWKLHTGVDIVDGIGNTENFTIFISNHANDIRPGSSGKPVAGFEVKIVDDDGNEVPQGELGNLMIKGETSTLFYLHQYEKSKEAFRGEWLFTGDKYYVDEDGYYWHAGRADDMLKVGGIWVSPLEVESALISHEAVFECAVVGETDTADLVKPKGFVVLNESYAASDELANALIMHCKERMASYKRPRWIEFVDDLPKTATGKLQRVKLRCD
jgi:benzoate-CoA ligase family protein